MALFRMPSLGADMEDGTLVEWLKQPGDALHAGDIVAVVETQKGAIEIEVFQPGVLERYLVQPGTTVPVGAPLAEIRGVDEPPVTAPPSSVAPAVPRAVPPALAASPPIPPPAPAPPPAAGALPASPAARAFAKEHGLDLAGLTGTGPGGAVLLADARAALQRHAAPAPVPPPARSAGLDPKAMRAAIAAAMSRAKREIPHYYLGHATEIGTALDWLARRNADRPPATRLLPAALFIKALALALRKLPEFNGFHRDGGFVPSDRVHIGIAIALRGGGLVAPAIHDTDTLALEEVMARLRDLVTRVRAGRFRGSELADPTVTLTSLGDRGVDIVMPVIYPPQVAILGLGTPRPRPWVTDGAVLARPVVDMSLAGDHRVSDGHRGALLLTAWADLLQQPENL